MNRGTVVSTFVLALFLAGIVPASGPQRGNQMPPPPSRQAQPTFRVQVELVQVDVTVVDAAGQFVKDLRQDDFELFEDDKPQQIAAFHLVDVPIKGNQSNALTFSLSPPDVRDNADNVTGRVYLIVMDDERTTLDKTSYGRTVAERFVRQYMEPGDIAAVVFTSARRNVCQEFTSDRRLVLAAVNRFMPAMPDPGAGEATPTGLVGEAATQRSIRSVVSTLSTLAQSLGHVSGGRKACVYIGPGFPVTQVGGTHPIGASEYRDLAAAANRANVTFYTIDPAGLSTLAEGANASTPDLDAAASHDALESSHEGLSWLAVDTGGFSVAGSNNFDRPFDRIRRETSSYYLLGYYPPQQKEGSTHRIAVRVKRPGLQVRARAGYLVPRASARPSSTLRTKNVPAALLPALDSPLPNAAIKFAVTAATFRGASKGSRWASVIVEINGADLDLGGKGGLDVGVVAIDKLDGVKGHDVRHVDLAMDPASLARLREAGLRVQSRVMLDGDIKSVRIAVADAATPRVGSLSIDLDAPEFDKQAASMSGVLMTSARAVQVPTTNPDEELRKRLGAPASTRRDFSSGDTIAWLTEVYQRRDAPKDLSVTTTITSGGGREVFHREEPHPAAESAAAQGAVPVVGRALLANLPPGAYVLRIEARIAGEKDPTSREIPFRIGG